MFITIWVVAGFISAILFFIDDLKRGENLIVSNFIFYLFLIFGGVLSLILSIMSFFFMYLYKRCIRILYMEKGQQ